MKTASPLRPIKLSTYLCSLLVVIVSLTQCHQDVAITIQKDEQAWNELKGQKDFWVYSFFIQAYPHSTHFDSALQNYFQYRDLLWESDPPPPLCFMNNSTYVIVIDSSKVLFEDTITSIGSLRTKAFLFIRNKSQDPTGPTIRMYEVPGTDTTRLLSKGIFEFQIKPEAESTSIVQEAVIQVSLAIEYYKKEVAHDWYNQDYETLKPFIKASLDTILGRRLYFDKYQPPPPLLDSLEAYPILNEKSPF